MPSCGMYNFLKIEFSNGNFSITLNTIRMLAGYRGNKIVVVEGKTDYTVLKNKFDSTIHVLLPFCKGNAAKIIMQIGTNYQNVIAVLDRDYDSIASDPRIFYYDHCNLEMMLVSDDDIFTNFSNYIIPKTLVGYRDDVLAHLKPISCLRLLNSMNMTTGCKQFSTEKVIGDLKTCLTLDNNALINSIRKGIMTNLCAPQYTDVEKNNILSAFNSKINSLMNINVYDITNGHDYNELFVTKVLPYQTISTEDDSDSIYCFYERTLTSDILKKTNLYAKIENYSTISGYKFFNF